MLTVGGLLLGAVLTAPVAASGAAPTDPFAPTEARVDVAQRDAAPRLRDPFAPEPAHLRAAATHLPPARPSADLLDPFAAASRRPASPATLAPVAAAEPPPTVSTTTTDLRAPFDPSTRVTAPAPAPTPTPQVRDPFRR